MAKIRKTADPSSMSASAINRELDILDAIESQFTDEMIEAGRGHERFSDWSKKDDELSKRGRDISDRRFMLRMEMELRYGPGVPPRLPRGFGPLK